MKVQKILQILKTAAKYFSTAAGAASLVIGLIALAVVVPPFVSIPVIAGIGLGAAYIGGRRKQRKIDEALAKEVMDELTRQAEKKEQKELLGLGRNLDRNVAEIAAVEHKIEERLAEQLVLEQKLEHELERQQCRPVDVLPHPAVQQSVVSEVVQAVSKPQLVEAIPVEQAAQGRSRVMIRISNLPTFFAQGNHAQPGAMDTVLEVATGYDSTNEAESRPRRMAV